MGLSDVQVAYANIYFIDIAQVDSFALVSERVAATVGHPPYFPLPSDFKKELHK